MSEFQKWTSQHRTIRASRDWNALLDHGLEKPASYIIRKNGSYYEAINGSTGKIDYGGANNAGGVSGSDAVAVIQNAIDAFPDKAGRVFLKGEFLISEPIRITRNYLSIEGENMFSTCLKLADGANCSIFEFTANYGVVRLRALELYGNRDNNTSGSGIYNIGYDGIYEHLVIHHFADYGIEQKELGGTNNRFLFVDCHNNGKSGFCFRSADQKFYFIRSYSNDEHGLDLFGATYYILYPYIFGNGKCGVYGDGVGGIQIEGGNISVNGEHGIFLHGNTAGIYNFKILGVRLEENSQSELTSYDAIHLEGLGAPWVSDGIISKNNIVGSGYHKNGIYIGNGVRRLSVRDNMVYEASAEDAINNVGGTDIKIEDNFGYLTRNKGVKAIPSGYSTVYVTHGLVAKPSHILLTGTHEEVKDCWVIDVYSTTFTIKSPAPVTADRDVYWEAEV